MDVIILVMRKADRFSAVKYTLTNLKGEALEAWLWESLLSCKISFFISKIHSLLNHSIMPKQIFTICLLRLPL